MAKVKLNKVIPALTLPSTNGKNLNLKELKGKKIVLYFYPKDNTPGCTLEGQEFSANYLNFKREKTIILGVSRESINSHQKFIAKYKFPFDLLSDQDEKACKLFDVIKEKNMYGRKFMGIERSTFLIDENGKLRREWRKVKVKGHAEEVLAATKELN
ncbi:MAG: peroxiredoxin [Pseudomonadota bacterium]|nr:peroxiredoxin [Pseudomonadota bacterium]